MVSLPGKYKNLYERDYRSSPLANGAAEYGQNKKKYLTEEEMEKLREEQAKARELKEGSDVDDFFLRYSKIRIAGHNPGMVEDAKALKEPESTTYFSEANTGARVEYDEPEALAECATGEGEDGPVNLNRVVFQRMRELRATLSAGEAAPMPFPWSDNIQQQREEMREYLSQRQSTGQMVLDLMLDSPQAIAHQGYMAELDRTVSECRELKELLGHLQPFHAV